MPVANMIAYGRRTYKTKEHPLYKTWRNLRYTQDYEDVWDDFAVFCEDVGQRPHRTDLKRINDDLPYGPNNFLWKRRKGF